MKLDPPPFAINEFNFNWRQWLSTLFSFLQVEDWHEIGTTGEPTFDNSWVNYGSPYETSAFYIDPFGIVRFKGAVKTGTSGTVAFILPVGYRPSANVNFANTESGGASGYVEINSNGEITVAGNNTYISLDNVSFRI